MLGDSSTGYTRRAIDSAPLHTKPLGAVRFAGDDMTPRAVLSDLPSAVQAIVSALRESPDMLLKAVVDAEVASIRRVVAAHDKKSSGVYDIAIVSDAPTHQSPS